MSFKINRRDALRAGGAGAVSLFLGSTLAGGFEGAQTSPSTPPRKLKSPPPKAIVFDTFGTVMDWRSTIIAEGPKWSGNRNLKVDWARFADEWRANYFPAMDKVRKGELPWTTVEVFYRQRLDQLLKEFQIDGLTEEEKVYWNRVWRRLQPWPDSIPGLSRLKKKFTISPLSDANFALLTEMSKHAGLPWDCILSAELARHYKPDREVYLLAADLLGHKPEEMMMAAAHAFDLKGARGCGFQTAFIYRPREYGPGDKADKANAGDFDIVAKSIVDLASQLGA